MTESPLAEEGLGRSPAAGDPARPIAVLMLCTANICRSPMAEVLLRARAERRQLPVRVASAGMLEGGRRPPPEVEAVLSARGLNAKEHLSRQVTSKELELADLVLGMERAHVRHAVVLEPACWPKTFTLKEFVRRAAEVAVREPDESFERWRARVHDQRDRLELLGESPLDDVADPYGGKSADYERTAQELDALIRQLVELIWPSPGAARF